MARLARLVIPGLPHHVTQRGNRRQPTFFNDGDYAAYLELMAEWCREEGVEIWSYCLMPNHVHLIAVPNGRVPGTAYRIIERSNELCMLSPELPVPGTAPRLSAQEIRAQGAVAKRLRQRIANPPSPVRIRAAPLGFSGRKTASDRGRPLQACQLRHSLMLSASVLLRFSRASHRLTRTGTRSPFSLTCSTSARA
jgi:REP element-mobilizing transposase RayT